MESLYDFISAHVIQPYGKRFLIATPLNSSDIEKLEDQWNLLDEDKNLGGFYKIKYDGWNSYLIIFSISHNQTLTYGMIAHEALHIVDYLFESIGHEYNYQNNEPGTYLIEYIVNTIMQHFIDRNLIKDLSTESQIKNKEEVD